MKHLYVTGTDTGVGKTRLCAALARAAANRDGAPRDVVKLVQTGLLPGEPGDAEVAAQRAGCGWKELHRFSLPADPWAAALDAGCAPLGAGALAAAVAELPRAAILEGSGGAAVPLNATESLSDAMAAARCAAVLVVGLRLGCISHALLTLEYLARRGIALRAAILCEAWGPTEPGYRLHVARVLAPHARVAGTLAFEPDPRRGIANDARAVASVFSAGPSVSERSPVPPR